MSKTTHVMANRQAALELVSGYSLEMTGKDVPGLMEAKDTIPAGTKINVTFLGNEDLEMRVSAAKAVRDLGFVPVPHISARRLSVACAAGGVPLPPAGCRRDRAACSWSAATRPTPEGPYEDSYDVIRTGLLQDYGVKEVSIAGYPEGHPDISDRRAVAGAGRQVPVPRAAGPGCDDPHPVRVRHRPGAGLDRGGPRPRHRQHRSGSARPALPASSVCSASRAASASARTR